MRRARLSEIMGKIVQAEDIQGMPPLEFSKRTYLSPYWAHLRPVLGFSEEIAEELVAYGVIYTGGWVVPCPFCQGQENAQLDEPFFRCCSCWNRAADFKALRVIYPTEVDQIEALVMKRPNGKSRGWVRGQTLDDLRAENEARGLG